MNDVQKTLVSQVRSQVFVKKAVLLDDNSVRFNFGRTNVDVSYKPSSDLYEVSVHKLSKDYVSTTETTGHVYAEDLGKFFPERYVMDANVRGLLAQVRAAKAA